MSQFHPRLAARPLALIALLLPLVAEADVQVDGRGALSTSIAIDVPTYYGITPSVQLSYSSAGGPGLAGTGWALTAASQVVRTSATGGISRLEASDRFWLDGEELVSCVQDSASPSCKTAVTAFGSSTGFYSTRRESRKRIQRSANHFTVWNPDGTREDYESVDNEASYQLTQVVDPWGHMVTYSWACTTVCELNLIRYGWSPFELAAPGTEVQFYREVRPDPWVGRNGAGLRVHGERLRSVVVRNHGSVLRAYRFSYQTGADSNASILAAVDQVGRDAIVDASGVVTAVSPPLPARRFQTPSLSGPGSFSLAAENTDPTLFAVTTPLAAPLAPRYPAWAPELDADAQTAQGSDAPLPMGFAPGDFDGDGRAEMLTWALHRRARKSRYACIPETVPPQFAPPTTQRHDCIMRVRREHRTPG